MPKKDYDVTKRRTHRYNITNLLKQSQTAKEAGDATDTILKVGLAGGIIGLQTYLLRLVVVPTAGTGQITLPGGGAAFLTYQGKQIQTIQWTFPQFEVAGTILQIPLITLMGSSGTNLSGGVISVVATGSLLGFALRDNPFSLFNEKVWQLADIYSAMFPPGSPGPSGTGVIEIKIDAWVAGQRLKFIGFALGVGAMSYFAWTKMGGALLR